MSNKIPGVPLEYADMQYRRATLGGNKNLQRQLDMLRRGLLRCGCDRLATALVSRRTARGDQTHAPACTTCQAVHRQRAARRTMEIR